MSLTPDQRSRFLTAIDLQTQAINDITQAREITQTLMNELDQDEPDPEPEPEPDVEQSIRDGAGAKGSLRVIASQADLMANGLPGTFNATSKTWSLPNCPNQWSDLDVRGIIYYTGVDTLKLVNVKCQGVQYKSASASTGGWFLSCTIVEKPGLVPGQGGINFYGQKNWTIDSCDISGFADGCQGVGPGLIMNSWVHDFILTSTTHNDGFQNYGGRIEVHNCVYDLGDDPVPMRQHTNGALFTSSEGASFEAWDLYVNCPSNEPQINALNGARGPIVVHTGKIKGGALPGQVFLDPAVVRIS